MTKAFRFGVVSAGTASPSAWRTLAQRVEELGYASLLMPDRTITPLAALTALAVAATATTTLRVGSYVFANDYRHPLLLAREVATLDQLSHGRVEFGIGAGVGASDFQQLGLPFDAAGTRVARFEEALSIIKAFFTAEVVNFSGSYYTISNLRSIPKPLQQPHPPIFIGSAGRRMLTLAAREADIIAPTLKRGPQGPDPTDVPLEQKIDWMREAAGERFERLELSQSAFGIDLTDSPSRATLAIQRERLGISYIQIQQGQAENFAPLVARMSGK